MSPILPYRAFKAEIEGGYAIIRVFLIGSNPHRYLEVKVDALDYETSPTFREHLNEYIQEELKDIIRKTPIIL